MNGLKEKGGGDRVEETWTTYGLEREKSMMIYGNISAVMKQRNHAAPILAIRED
jgi:hypothetical protein